MRYCTKCRKVYAPNEELCTACGEKLQKDVQPDNPVYLITSCGFELDRILAVLQDEKIPYAQQRVKRKSSAHDVTGEIKWQENLYVPYGMLQQAQDALIGIGAMQPEGEAAAPEYAAEGVPAHEKAECEEMHKGKRLVWRLLSAVLLIVLIWGVVAVTDQLVAVIKQLL